MDQQPLEDVGVTAQMGTAHAAGVIQVCERAFDQFAAPTHQTTSAPSSDPATVPIHRRLGFGFLRPIAAAPVAEAAADIVDQNRGTAARVLSNAASSIHDGAPRLPGGEGVARWAEAAADEIDATAQYVRGHNTHQMLADLRQVVRRNPGAWVLGAAVVGVLVGRGFRK